MINLSTWSTFYDVAHGVLFLPHWPKSYRNDKPFPAYFRRRTHHTTLRHTIKPKQIRNRPAGGVPPSLFPLVQTVDFRFVRGRHDSTLDFLRRGELAVVHRERLEQDVERLRKVWTFLKGWHLWA